MKSESSKVLKTLLVSYHPQDHKAFYSYLSERMEANLKALGNELPLFKEDFASFGTWYGRIHYSWYRAFLETLPKKIQELLLTLFPEEERKNLHILLELPEAPTPSLSPLAHFFLFGFLQEKMHLQEKLPPVFYNSSPLYPIFQLSKKELVFLIDLLGIYDLAFEMHKIVDKNQIQKIHAALTPEEMNFLQFALKQQSRFAPQPLHLNAWDGEKKKLKTLLHYRGLMRLSHACSQEESGFQWHLIHALDIGRGNVLMKLFQGKSDPAMIPYFQNQVLGLIQRIHR